jgi:hypothetical protein
VVHQLGLDRLFVALRPEEVQALLLRLAVDLDTDLTAARVRAFCAEFLDATSDDDPLLETEVQYEGGTVPLVFEYIRDSEAGAELMVLGPPPVVEQVQRQITSLRGSASLRLIPSAKGKRQ